MLFRRITTLPSEEIGGEFVILDAENDLFFSSNAVGTLVWRELAEGRSLDELCDAVVANFDGAERAIVKADLTEFLDDLSKRNLVERIVQNTDR